jgi:hypothetical protein
VRTRLRHLRRMLPGIVGREQRPWQPTSSRVAFGAWMGARTRVTQPPERERYMRAVEVECASAEAGPAVARIIPVVAAEDEIRRSGP